MSDERKKSTGERPVAVPREIVPVIRVTSVVRVTVRDGQLTTIRAPLAA